MKLTSVRMLASLVPLSLLAPLLAGCSGAPDAAAEHTGAESSAILISNPGSIIVRNPLPFDPTAECSTSPANFVLPLSVGASYDEVLTANPEASCPYGVIEVDGTMGHEVNVAMWASSTVTKGMTQSECQASSFSFDVMGYVPGHIVITGVGTATHGGLLAGVLDRRRDDGAHLGGRGVHLQLRARRRRSAHVLEAPHREAGLPVRRDRRHVIPLGVEVAAELCCGGRTRPTPPRTPAPRPPGRRRRFRTARASNTPAGCG